MYMYIWWFTNYLSNRSQKGKYYLLTLIFMELGLKARSFLRLIYVVDIEDNKLSMCVC